MLKKIEVKGHMELANKVTEYKKNGYGVTYKLDGKEYVLRKGIRQIVKITRV